MKQEFGKRSVRQSHRSMYQQLRQSVATIASLTERELRLFEQQCIYREVPKKFTLVEEGQVARELYFINRGCLRFYYNRDGDEITGFIFLENMFATALDSFLQQEPSAQIVETLEDCELLVISYSALQQLYDYSTNFQIFGRKLAEQRLVNAQRILSSYILDSPEERYRKLLATQPEWLLRVPQHYIASFLGITPVSLSRIRKRMT